MTKHKIFLLLGMGNGVEIKKKKGVLSAGASRCRGKERSCA
jgi:hypothetical protein